jgi:hypothetical protein
MNGHTIKSDMNGHTIKSDMNDHTIKSGMNGHTIKSDMNDHTTNSGMNDRTMKSDPLRATLTATLLTCLLCLAVASPCPAVPGADGPSAAIAAPPGAARTVPAADPFAPSPPPSRPALVDMPMRLMQGNMELLSLLVRDAVENIVRLLPKKGSMPLADELRRASAVAYRKIAAQSAKDGRILAVGELPRDLQISWITSLFLMAQGEAVDRFLGPPEIRRSGIVPEACRMVRDADLCHRAFRETVDMIGTALLDRLGATDSVPAHADGTSPETPATGGPKENGMEANARP